MPAPTPLSIKTSAVTRLVKEEASYHREQTQQQALLDKLHTDGADEYAIKQQKKVVDETVLMVPAVREKLRAALEALENELEACPEAENKDKATSALASGRKVLEDGN